VRAQREAVVDPENGGIQTDAGGSGHDAELLHAAAQENQVKSIHPHPSHEPQVFSGQRLFQDPLDRQVDVLRLRAPSTRGRSALIDFDPDAIHLDFLDRIKSQRAELPLAVNDLLGLQGERRLPADI